MGFFSSIGNAVGSLVGGSSFDNLASTALSFLGGERRNDAQIEQAQITSAMNAQQAWKNRRFQKRMSDTSYRRAMTDMRKSGLNPVLAYKLGGASSPGGSTASAVMPQIYDSVTPAVNTGLQAMQTQSNVDLQESQSDVNDVQVEKITEEIKNLEASRDLTEEQTRKIAEEVALLEQQIRTEVQRTRREFYSVRKIDEETEALIFDNVQRKVLADFYDSAEFARVAKDLGVNPSTLGAILKFFFRNK
jgi:hypothetical protein